MSEWPTRAARMPRFSAKHAPQLECAVVTCERVGAQVPSLGAGFEGWRVAPAGLPPLRRRRGAPGPMAVAWWPRGAAAGEGGRVDRLDVTRGHEHGLPAEPSLPASLVRSSAVIPDGWLCLQAKGSAIGFCRGGMLSAWEAVAGRSLTGAPLLSRDMSTGAAESRSAPR